MNAIFKISVIFLSLFLCTGCRYTEETVKKPQRIDSLSTYHTDSFSTYRPKKMGFFVLGSGEVKSYHKAFKKMYSNEERFVKKLEKRALPVLDRVMGRSKIVSVSPETHTLLSKLIQKNHGGRIRLVAVQEEIAKVLDAEGLDGLIFVNHWRLGSGVAHGTAGFGNLAECRIYLQGGLINNLGRTLFYDESVGRGTVGLYDKQDAIEDAFDDSIDRFGDMVSGRVKKKRGLLYN